MSKTYVAMLSYLLFFYLLSRINIYICLLYKRCGSDDHIEIEVKMLGGLILYKIKIPVVRISSEDVSWFMSEIGSGKEKTQTYPKREQRFIKRIIKFYMKHPKRLKKTIKVLRYYHQLYRRYMNHIMDGTTCEVFYWRTKIGSDDASITAITSGSLWALKEILLVNLGKRVNIKQTRPIIQVIPVFGTWYFETELKCIFQVRLGHVISATTQILQINRNEEAAKRVRTSNTGINEDGHGKH